MSTTPRIDTNKVFELLEASSKRITVMQGGTRSGKTYNILIWFIAKLLRENGKVLTIVRASMPSIKGSVMRDFIDILDKLGLYKDELHNKTENVFYLGTNVVEFVSIDQPQKIRGRKRTYAFLNEANELDYDSFMQIAFRTESKIVLDYNPSDEFNYIYDHVIPRDDADFHITTYLDNPFLSKDIVAEIERLKEVDENYWRVYGLGQKGVAQNLIYTHWKYCQSLPPSTKYSYGLDFGFKAPTALVRCLVKDAIHCEELLYEPNLTMDDLIVRLNQVGVSKRDNLWCDSAEPKSIETLKRAGFNAKPGIKKVEEGIRKVQSMPLFVTESSVNFIKELRNYKWVVVKNSDGKVPDKERPNKQLGFDNLCDALRMCVHSETSKKMLSWV